MSTDNGWRECGRNCGDRKLKISPSGEDRHGRA